MFDNVRQWRICIGSGVRETLRGLWRIVSCLLFGFLSVFWWIGREIKAFCKREFVAAVIVGLISLMGLIGWVGTFVHERAARATAEMQRDSLSYRLKQYTDIGAEPITTIVVDGDTIHY